MCISTFAHRTNSDCIIFFARIFIDCAVNWIDLFSCRQHSKYSPWIETIISIWYAPLVLVPFLRCHSFCVCVWTFWKTYTYFFLSGRQRTFPLSKMNDWLESLVNQQNVRMSLILWIDCSAGHVMNIQSHNMCPVRMQDDENPYLYLDIAKMVRAQNLFTYLIWEPLSLGFFFLSLQMDEKRWVADEKKSHRIRRWIKTSASCQVDIWVKDFRRQQSQNDCCFSSGTQKWGRLQQFHRQQKNPHKKFEIVAIE